MMEDELEFIHLGLIWFKSTGLIPYIINIHARLPEAGVYINRSSIGNFYRKPGIYRS